MAPVLYSVVSQLTMSLVAICSPRLSRADELGLAADADDVLAGFGARPRKVGLLAQVDRELDVHGCFDAGAGRLAVALQRMAVADEQQRARMDRPAA